MTGTNGGATRGSALVVAMLVTAILALLGISFLVLAETERRIAENEERAAQALYVAEAGLRTVKRWFDDPRDALGFPAPSVVDRSLRRILDESDPDPSAAVPADGLVGSYPYYKQGLDVDGDGLDDLFDRPYRGTPLHALQGTPDGPDLRIDDADSAAAAFLADLSSTLVGAFPGESGGVHARISRIDVYAPPYERFGSIWQRGGIATVAVTARIYQDLGSAPRVLAERRLEGVLGEAPYRAVGLQGPLQSCKDLEFVPRTGGDLTVRWGALAASGAVRVGPGPEAPPVPASLPRRRPPRPGADPLFPDDPTQFEEFVNTLGTSSIDDPWFRILAGGTIEGTAGSPWPRGLLMPAVPQDYSNLQPNLGVAVCPSYDYRLWKTIAQSGGADVHYFAWAGTGDSWRENGREDQPPRSFREITHGQTGAYFFDTRDGDEPEDADANGVFDNLTPGITVSGGDWSFSGFIFLNADSFQVDGVTGVPTMLRPPGEPFLDVDDDGQYDAGEPFVNLDYATAIATDGRVQADPDTGSRDARGPDVAGASVSFRGLLYSTGSFEATGAGTFYGAVVAVAGVTQTPDDGSATTPVLIWDGTLATDWPPEELPGVPRVVITDWQVPR